MWAGKVAKASGVFFRNSRAQALSRAAAFPSMTRHLLAGASLRAQSTLAVAPPKPGFEVMVRETGKGKFTNNIQGLKENVHFSFTADEPSRLGGSDSGPSPYDLLLGSLAACKSMTIRMFAERKQWPVERITVYAKHAKVYSKDCANCLDEKDRGYKGRLDKIDVEIELEGNLDEQQLKKIGEIAEMCPVGLTLHHHNPVVITQHVKGSG